VRHVATAGTQKTTEAWLSLHYYEIHFQNISLRVLNNIMTKTK
jgi:hypothetical protein